MILQAHKTTRTYTNITGAVFILLGDTPARFAYQPFLGLFYDLKRQRTWTLSLISSNNNALYAPFFIFITVFPES